MACLLRDVFQECQAVAKNVDLQCKKVQFNKSLCRVIANLYFLWIHEVDMLVFQNSATINPDCETALVELRRAMLCGQTLVTDWSRNDWWMSVITSSASASVEMAVFLNLRDVRLCAKVLIGIAADCVPLRSTEAGYCSHVSISGDHEVSKLDMYTLLRAVKAESEKDMDSLLRRIEQYSQRYFISPSKSAKLARHLLGKLKPEISNDGHPPHLIEYDDVRISDEPLGEGASGAVFKCDFLGRRAAAKVLIRKITNREAVENEINLLSRVRHPNVVRFIGYTYKETRNDIVTQLTSKDLRTYVIVTELMSKDLRTYLDEKKEGSRQRQPPLSLLLAINIMLQIAGGMKHLHESGVVHRDLKSNNVLVNVADDQDGSPLSSSRVQVKLTDFGVSKLNLHDSGCSTRNVGTTKWRAPEVFEDEENREKYTNSADVYSFAIIFSEVLTGEMPFQGMPQTNLLQRIRNGERPPLPHVDYCPDYLSELINKCWATNPRERPRFREICQSLVDCKQKILMQSHLVSSRSSQRSILEKKGLGCLEVDSVEAEDNKDIVKQDDKRANFNQSTDCAESSLRMAHLVIDGIDTVLHQTKYFDNKGGDVKNSVVLNRWQCCHLAKKLSKMKVWLLQEHQNLQTIPGATLALQHLLRVVQRANVLVQESYRSEFSWLRAAVLQAGNEEAFLGIVQDLKWCTHILNVTLKSGMSTSEEILSVGNRENLHWLQEDHALGTEADLDKRELLENLTQSKKHHSSFQKHGDAIQQYLLERYSQHASAWDVEGHLPLLLWDTKGDNALPVMEQLGHGAYGEVHKTSWWELDCAMKTFPAATEWYTEFRKVAAIWTSLKHPNITQLICCTKDRKACSIVMELMSTDLHKLMDKRMSDHPNHKVPFSMPVVVDIMLQMARALKYIHGKGVAHLDIKPSNILATPASVPELADLGYVDVKLVDFGDAQPLRRLSSSTCTMHTANVGTTQYRAPELFQVPNNCCTGEAEEWISNRIDALKADVYSYGITCAELLTGEYPYPFPEFQRTDLLSTILQGVRPHLPHEYCPVSLQDLIVRCWDTQPCNRPSFLQICEELMNFKTVI